MPLPIFIRFLNYYGFDGIDIDWEYPGAPDRGGKPEDPKNFVALVRTLRSTFDASPRSLGLTFTIPSSYWYLRWFDMPALMKYADWTNLMSYDLHGTWDKYDPIGNIVQGHTNLTEIKQAAQLLWRVGIKPEQVAIGFGFYGRSFELTDPDCTKPGCPFRGGARAGPFSDTSGILMHYEIQAILAQKPGLKPVHDEESGVNYLVFDKNQWVSFDDATTFKQKLDWADEIGFSGSLIWASDTDDDKYRAMSGLMGAAVSHPQLPVAAFSATSDSVSQNLVGQNGQDCKRMNDCVDPDIVRCPSGFKKVGWDKDGCKSGGKLICCPIGKAPSTCQWRGGGKDCNGQCHPGEATLFGSSWYGGGFEAESDTSRCNRGYKVFCCGAGDWKDVIQGCHWTKCGGSCVVPDREIVSSHDGCSIFHPEKKYCCPSNAPLHDCTWRGTPLDCPDAKCKSNEVAVANDGQGDSGWGCFWGRKRTACCQVSKPPPPPLTCDITTCDIDPGLCQIADGGGLGMSKRHAVSKRDLHTFERRNGKREFIWKLFGGKRFSGYSRPYITPNTYLRLSRDTSRRILDRWFRMNSRSCANPRAELVLFRGNEPPVDGQVEHTLPEMIASRYAQTLNWGLHYSRRPLRISEYGPDGRRIRNQRVPDSWFDNTWNNPAALAAGVPRVTPDSPDLGSPLQRFYEALGSNTNPTYFTMLHGALNAAKNSLEIYNMPMALKKFKAAVKEGASTSDEAEYAIERFMTPMREVSAHARETMRTYIAHARGVFSASNSEMRESVLKELKKLEDRIPNLKYNFET
ncbi:hypothetical protein BDV06DRAFT_232270 [Aspergillus oleicola]